MTSLQQNHSLTVLMVDPSLNQGMRGNVLKAMLEKNKELLRYKRIVKELQEEIEKLKRERDHHQEHSISTSNITMC